MRLPKIPRGVFGVGRLKMKKKARGVFGVGRLKKSKIDTVSDMFLIRLP